MQDVLGGEGCGNCHRHLRALSHAYDYSREGRSLALELLDKALAMDPDYAEAHGLAALEPHPTRLDGIARVKRRPRKRAGARAGRDDDTQR